MTATTLRKDRDMASKRPETYSDMNPGRFIAPDKLKDKDVTLTIKDFLFEEMVNGRKPDGSDDVQVKCILYFKETDKGMKVNKTNQVCLQTMFGGKPADAIGKKVTLMYSTARFGRDVHPCIRFRGSPDIDKPVVASIRKRGGKSDEYKLTPTK